MSVLDARVGHVETTHRRRPAMANPETDAVTALLDFRAWIADHAGESISRVTLKNQIDSRVQSLQCGDA